VDSFADMSDEELERYVNGDKGLDECGCDICCLLVSY
jgi:predicted house-cleaning NTP pyrophosphatase (Maf/HAM1 superfamily)